MLFLAVLIIIISVNQRLINHLFSYWIIYVYEGAIQKSKNRRELVNKRYFTGNLSPDDLWLEVADYIYEAYDLENINDIYIAGDGASWIKQGVKQLTLPKIETKYALDIFHFKQAINNIIDDKDYKNLLINYIIKDREDDYKKVIKTIK